MRHAVAPEAQPLLRAGAQAAFRRRAERWIGGGEEEDGKQRCCGEEHQRRHGGGHRAEQGEGAGGETGERRAAVSRPVGELGGQKLPQPVRTERAVGAQPIEQSAGQRGQRVEQRRELGEEGGRLGEKRREEQREEPAEEKEQKERQQRGGEAALEMNGPPQEENDRLHRAGRGEREKKGQQPPEKIAEKEIERCGEHGIIGAGEQKLLFLFALQKDRPPSCRML